MARAVGDHSLAQRHLAERIAGEATCVPDAGVDGGPVYDAIPETHVALLVLGDAAHPAVHAVVRRVCALLMEAVRAAHAPDLVPAHACDSRKRLDRLARYQRLVVLEVAVGEPEGRPLPVGQDVEVLTPVRDSGLGQTISGTRR